MNEQQRRLWCSMTERLDAYEHGTASRDDLILQLKGLLDASDLHNEVLRDEFSYRVSPLYYLPERVGGPPHPEGELMVDAIYGLRNFIAGVLAATNDELS